MEEFLRQLVVSRDGLDQQLMAQPGPICREREVKGIMRSMVQELKESQRATPQGIQQELGVSQQQDFSLSAEAQADRFFSGMGGMALGQ